MRMLWFTTTHTCVLVLLLPQVVFNPKDSNTFASASLDRTVKVSRSRAALHAANTADHNHTV